MANAFAKTGQKLLETPMNTTNKSANPFKNNNQIAKYRHYEALTECCGVERGKLNIPKKPTCIPK